MSSLREMVAVFEGLEGRLLLSLTPVLEGAAELTMQPKVALEVAGEISQPLEQDAYKFTSPAGGVLTASLTSGEELGSMSLSLYDGSGRMLIEMVDAEIQASVIEGQVYYLQAQAIGSQTGYYDLSVLNTPIDAIGDFIGEAKVLKLSGNGTAKTSSRIDYGSDVDVFKATATKDGILQAAVTNTATLKKMVGRVAILDTQGNVLAVATAGSAAQVAQASAEVKKGQVVYIMISSANNAGDPYTLNTKIDLNQAPVMDAISAVSVEEGKPVSFTVSATDANGDTLVYSATNLPTGATFNASTRTFSWTPAVGQVGTYSPTFTVTDGKATDSKQAAITVAAAAAVDNVGGWSGTAGTITLDAAGAATVDNRIDTADDQDMFKFVATVSGTMTARVVDTSAAPAMLPRLNSYDSALTQVDSHTATSASQGATLTFEVVKGETYYLKVLSNNATAAPYRLTGTTAVSSQAPVMEAIAPVNVETGKPVAFTVRATDPDGQTLTYSASNLPTGALFNAATQQFNWTPTESQTGTFNPVFTVSDGTLTASQTAQITVIAAAMADNVGGWSGTAGTITLSSAGAATVDNRIDTSDDQDMFKFTATQSGLMQLVLANTATTPAMVGRINLYDGNVGQVASATASSASNAATIEYQVTAGQTYYVKVLADNLKPDPYRLAITTDAAAVVNQAPVIDAIAPITVPVNTWVQFVINATDPDGDALTYSATNLPSGSTFDAATRTFTWTPTAAGTASPRFNVNDGNLTSTLTVSITATTTSSTPVAGGDMGYLGAGKTSAYFIDRDGDGYGPNSSNGPDADDNDASVNTYSSAINKYGSVSGVVSHLGYNTGRIFYISKTGSNSGGAVNDINKPYASFAGVSGSLRAGDTVIFRAGTYTSGTAHDASVIKVAPGVTANGTSTNPIVVMAMPGEKVTLQAASSSYRTHGIWYSGVGYVFDGFNVTGNTASGSGVKMASGAAYGTFRNLNVYHNFWGIQMSGGWNDILIENVVSHDNNVSGGEHGIYVGSHSSSRNITIRNNVIYRNGSGSIGQGIHMNGVIDNARVEGNIIHSNSTSGIDLMNGVRNSTFRNNVIFSHGSGQPFILSNYSGGATAYTAPMDNNQIINNTFIGTSGNSSRSNVIRVNVDSSSSAKNLVIRNNVLYMDGYSSSNVVQFDNGLWWRTAIIENNVTHSKASSNFMSVSGTKYSLSQAQAASTLIRNNVWSVPRFENYSGDLNTWRFDLLSGSPAINIGLTTNAPLLDMRGTSRLGAIDAGAYEYR